MSTDSQHPSRRSTPRVNGYAHEASLRADAEARAQQAALEGIEWKELALMSDAERAKLEAELAARQATQKSEQRVDAFVARADEAGKRVVLDEGQTRLLIDAQLRDAGWEADTTELTYEKGARPAPHKNRAIAEWPVEGGRADYVLFVGVVAVGVLEAKRETIDVAGAIDQAKRYSRGLLHAELPSGSPWRDYRVPFLFAHQRAPLPPSAGDAERHPLHRCPPPREPQPGTRGLVHAGGARGAARPGRGHGR